VCCCCYDVRRNMLVWTLLTTMCCATPVQHSGLVVPLGICRRCKPSGRLSWFLSFWRTHAATQVSAAIADLNAQADAIVCANPRVMQEYL
jgi:hypothetical protein